MFFMLPVRPTMRSSKKRTYWSSRSALSLTGSIVTNTGTMASGFFSACITSPNSNSVVGQMSGHEV